MNIKRKGGKVHVECQGCEDCRIEPCKCKHTKCLMLFFGCGERGRAYGMFEEFEETSDPVTCKNCLRVIK